MHCPTCFLVNVSVRDSINLSSMELFRLSKKYKLYLTLFLVIHCQLLSVLCRDQNPANENVSVKSPSEKDTASADDSKDSLSNKKDSETDKKTQDNLSTSELSDNVTDKVIKSDADTETLTPSSNQTNTTDTGSANDLSNVETQTVNDEEPDSEEEIDLDDEDLVSAGQNYQYVLKKLKQLAGKTQHSLTEFSKLAESQLDSFDMSTLVALLREASKLGYDSAKLVLAKLYFYGDSVELDLNEAHNLFSELSAKGNTDAHLVCILFTLSSKLTFLLCFSISASCTPWAWGQSNRTKPKLCFITHLQQWEIQHLLKWRLVTDTGLALASLQTAISPCLIIARWLPEWKRVSLFLEAPQFNEFAFWMRWRTLDHIAASLTTT